MLRQLRAITLQWYVTREFIMLFFVTLLATTVLVLLLLAFQLVTEFEQMGISLGQVLLLSPFIMPGAIVQALPPATMIASIMVFGRMSAENEILAAQSGGAPLRILAIPLIVCGILITISSLWIQDTGVRWGNNTIRTNVLKINQPEFFQNLDKPGSSLTIQPDATTTVRINMLPVKKNAQGKDVKPIQIVYFQNGKMGQTVFAEDHQFMPPAQLAKPAAGQPAAIADRTLVVRLSDVQIFGDRTSYSDVIDWGVALPDIGAMFFTRGISKSWMENKENAERLARDEHLRWEFLLRRAADYGALAAAGSMLDPVAPALVSNAWNVSKQHTVAIMDTGGAHDRMKVEVIEFHRKVALSLLPIAMIFLGLGLGLLVKKSNRMIGFLIGVGLYCLLYIPLTIVAKSLSSSTQLGPYAWAAQYIPSMLFFSVGCALWFGYERGHITDLPPVLRLLRPMSAIVKLTGVVKWLYAGALKLISIPVKLFSRTADRYVASTFLAPLIVIIFCIGGFITAIDVIEHHSEIVDGIVRADEPLGTLPVRSQGQAFVDLLIYYAIQTLEITLDILPLEVLMAGMLCSMVLVRNQEHLILKSSGMRLQRALLPIMALTLLASLGVSAVRQFAMPALVMQRDWLRPQIYHRSPQSSAFALYTFDDKNKPLLFAVSQYESATQSGHDLRIYMLGDQKNKRIPTYSTDFFKWDGQAWQFWTDPVMQEQALLAAKSFGGGAPKSAANSKKKPGAGQAAPALKPGGVFSVTEGLVAPGEIAARAVDAEVLRATVTHKSQVNSWKGPIDPNFIDSERLGARVMRLEELDALSAYKPTLKVDWYRRISECLMGLFLLWCAVPLMFNDSTGSPVKAIAMSVLFAAVYWGLCEVAASKARANVLPAWAPLLPHAGFCLLGIWQFFKRLQT